VTFVTPAAVHLDDLAEPRFSPEVDQILAVMAAMAPECPLDADVLHEKAIRETGLDDFGAGDYRERLEVYLAALREISGLHGAGVVNLHSQLLQCLKNRLLLTDLLKRHPEIHDIDLVSPVFITGLPRTGTTHLHNLIGTSSAFRTLPYWEGVEPFPLPAEAGVEPDPRLARMDMAVGFLNAVMPHFPLIHEMTTAHAHEEIQLLFNDFSTMLMEVLADVPQWRDYYRSHDQTPHYEYLATQLKALQFLGGGRRWLLKSPQHLEQLPALSRVFPDAVVVCTHRDPVPVALSFVTMITYSARMHRSPIPVQELAVSMIDRLQMMLDAFLRDRDLIGPERSVDIRLEDFMSDELGVAESIFGLAGEEVTEHDRAAMAEYLAGHQRNRLGRVAISAEMFGLDEDDLSARFAPYRDRFLA
jgi:hypothetical protein